MERTQSDLPNIDGAIEDVINEFPNIEFYRIKQAIKNGSLGHYGRTYRMSTQEVCIWIKEYIKQNPTPKERQNSFI